MIDHLSLVYVVWKWTGRVLDRKVFICLLRWMPQTQILTLNRYNAFSKINPMRQLLMCTPPTLNVCSSRSSTIWHNILASNRGTWMQRFLLSIWPHWSPLTWSCASLSTQEFASLATVYRRTFGLLIYWYVISQTKVRSVLLMDFLGLEVIV